MLKLYAKTKTLLWRLRGDSEGATIIEYSLLIGLISVAVVATVGTMGLWVSGEWTSLLTGVTTAPAAVPTP